MGRLNARPIITTVIHGVIDMTINNNLVSLLLMFISALCSHTAKVVRRVSVGCLLVLIGSTAAYADTKLHDVSINASSSEWVAPPRIHVMWNDKNTQRKVTDDPIYLPLKVSGKIKNVDKSYKIVKAWVFVPGSTKTTGSAIPPYGYTLLRNNPVRDIGGSKTVVFTKKYLRHLEEQAINICNAKAQANKTSFHRINISLALSVTAGKAYYGGHKKLVHKSDGTVIAGDVACHRKQPGVRSSAGVTGPGGTPRAKPVSELNKAEHSPGAVRSNPKPARTSPAPVRTGSKPVRTSPAPIRTDMGVANVVPDLYIRGVKTENNRTLAAFVHSKGGVSGQCILLALYSLNGEAKVKQNAVGPFKENETIKSLFRFKRFTSGVPAVVDLRLHCPVDRNRENNEANYHASTENE